MNNHPNRPPYMYESHRLSSTDADLRTIVESRKCLTFVIERYFHPKVICAEQGGTCERLENTILLLSRNLKREEQLMEQSGYPGLIAHVKAHDTILRNLETLRRTFVCGNYNNNLVLDFITEWAEDHTRTFDNPYGEYLKEQGIEFIQGEDI